MANIPAEILLLVCLAALGLAVAAFIAWQRCRDPLHPAIWLSALFFLGLVVDPVLTLQHPEFEDLFPEYEGVWTGLSVQYLGMGALFLGILAVRGPRFAGAAGRSIFDPNLTESQRARLRGIAWIVGLTGLAAFWISIIDAGGLFEVYSEGKGGVGRIRTGYQGEAMMLGLPAMVLYALGIQGKPLTFRRFLPLLLFCQPMFLPGVFGGMRGNLFRLIMGFFVACCIARGRLPTPKVIALVFAFAVVMLVFAASQRHSVYIGSEEGFDFDRFRAALIQENLSPGDNVPASVGAILVHMDSGQFHYGRRFFITYCIRPIPAQLWPNQYNDATRLLYGEQYHYREILDSFGQDSWNTVHGWRPPTGYAVNSIVDMFAEFGWGFVVACWLLGYGIGWIWSRFRYRGGLWLVYYAAVLALAIYLPTQSLSAFGHRLIFICVAVYLFSKIVGRIRPSASEGAPAPASVPRQW